MKTCEYDEIKKQRECKKLCNNANFCNFLMQTMLCAMQICTQIVFQNKNFAYMIT